MDGKVRVNGMQTKSALTDIVVDEDKVSVGSLKIFPENKFSVPNLWIANKLANEKLSFKPGLQKDISMFRRFEKANVPSNLVPINSLDFIGEGLCLLTDDPNFAYYMNRPYGNKPLEKEYRVRVHGLVSQSKVQGMKYGVTVDGTSYKPFHVTVESAGPSDTKRKKSDEGLSRSANSWLRIVTTDTHPRGIKNVLERMFVKVNRLICTRVDGYRVPTKSIGNDRTGKPQQLKGKAQGEAAKEGALGALPLPGQIVGPISILHNKYQDQSIIDKKLSSLSSSLTATTGIATATPMDLLQQNLLSYLYIQQTTLARIEQQEIEQGGRLGNRDNSSSGSGRDNSQKISNSSILRF